MPTLSVVVPVFNSIGLLAPFFASLAPQLPNNAQVVIVDDASTEPVLEAIPDLPAGVPVATARNATNLGHAGAVNRGFGLSTGEVIIHLNTDLVLRAGCVEALVDAVVAGGDAIGVVGAKLVYPTTGRTQSVGMAFGLHSKRHVFRHLPAEHPLCTRTRTVQIVAGATGAFTRKVFDRVGPFDEGMYNQNPDIDYCMRASASGLQNVACAEAVAYHWRNRSGPIRYARANEAEAAFWAKWGGRYTVDLGCFVDEAIDQVLSMMPALSDAPFALLDLSRGGDQQIVLDRIFTRWPGLAERVRPFRQMSSDDQQLSLPLELPNWLVHEPTPFLYLVDDHLQLSENAMWFAQRRRVVTEELVIDLSASACTTSELCDWTASGA